jgi:hypothetical protein
VVADQIEAIAQRDVLGCPGSRGQGSQKQGSRAAGQSLCRKKFPGL